MYFYFITFFPKVQQYFSRIRLKLPNNRLFLLLALLTSYFLHISNTASPEIVKYEHKKIMQKHLLPLTLSLSSAQAMRKTWNMHLSSHISPFSYARSDAKRIEYASNFSHFSFSYAQSDAKRIEYASNFSHFTFFVRPK